MLEAAQIRDVAQRHAYVFDNGLSSPDFFDVEKRMASEEFRLLREHVMPEWDVLEVGCFTGLNLLGLAKIGHSGLLCGVDFVGGAIDWLLEQAEEFPKLVGFRETFPYKYQGGMRNRDAVVAFDVLEHQQNVGQFLDGVAGELKPGGTALILVPAGKSFYDCGHVAFWPDCETLANTLGYHFTVKEIRQLKTCDKLFAICTRRD